MPNIKVTELLIEIIKASEKAAQIARLCRAEEELFKLLVQQKCEETKNPRFVQDFKTLADVLVQETVRHDLGEKFPGISDTIFGEENNKFENTIGESVVVKIEKTSEGTSNLLLKVLDGNYKAANLLANVVHSSGTVNFDEYLTKFIDENISIELNLNDIGIWIDPIDSTSEYVNGVWKTSDNESDDIITTGLQCVTCLIGVYESVSGIPLMGVCNQPFYKSLESYRELRYSGRYYWGFDINGIRKNNIPNELNIAVKNVILIGGNEPQNNINALKRKNKVIYAAGAGYKLLCLALSLTDTYISSQPSTYRWDTCATHAILKSIGGGILSFNDTIALKDKILTQTDKFQINYLENKSSSNGMKKWCNLNGIIGYRSLDCLKATIDHLVNN